MTGFTIQEFIISGLYIWKTLEILKGAEKKRSHRLMWQLFSINVIIMVLDVGLLTIEYLGYSVLEQTIKGVTYSVKLKLELAILNKLVEVSQTNNKQSTLTFGDTKDFLDPTKTVWDITRFAPPFSSSSNTSHPKWMNDLEKTGINHIETAYSPAEYPRSRQNTRYMDEGRGKGKNPDAIRPETNRQRTCSESELLYADAVRKIAR